jgi:hypothetical protein
LKKTSFFLCECGFNFESLPNWNCWELIESTITCPKCKTQYHVNYDAIEDDEAECSDKWWLTKKN